MLGQSLVPFTPLALVPMLGRRHVSVSLAAFARPEIWSHAANGAPPGRCVSSSSIALSVGVCVLAH